MKENKKIEEEKQVENPVMLQFRICVIPAKAGTQKIEHWMPAFAGMTLRF
ncbi:MAG: hypothetical protein KGJ59_11035 [Bacteroidota bacterium]|nr:hypothetical protein [Bacteroidota bacterium]